MKADIIFPCYNASDIAWRSLTHLLLFISPRDYHIIVVDDGSSDDTPLLGQFVEAHGGTYIRNVENVGAHEAWNIGCRHAKTDTFIVMNNDMLVGPGVLDALVAGAAEHGFVCVNEVSSVDGRRASPTVFLTTQTPGMEPLLYGYSFLANASYGSLFAVTRQVWGDGVDSRMRLVLADVDFVYRLQDRGYTPQVDTGHLVYHLGSQTRIRAFSADPAAELQQQQQDFLVFYEKWKNFPAVLALHTPGEDTEATLAFLRERNASRISR